VWADNTMHFVKGFPKVGSKLVIPTAEDRFLMYAQFIPLGHPYTVTTVAHAFFSNIFRLHVIPFLIVHDPTFMSNIWQELFKLSNVCLQMSMAFQLQYDGQPEVMNKVITMYLRCIRGNRLHQWVQWLPWAKGCYNSTYQDSLRTSPF
jgi:hypothetical protein